MVETRVEGRSRRRTRRRATPSGQRERTALDDPRRRQGDDLARADQGRRPRLRRHARRNADDQADRGAARQSQRIADARLPDRRPLRRQRRARRFRASARRLEARAAKPGAAAAGRPAIAAERQRGRRGPHHRRSFRTSVGGRARPDDADRGQRLWQDGFERAGRGDAASARLSQSARARARRTAPRPHPRSRPCGEAGG